MPTYTDPNTLERPPLFTPEGQSVTELKSTSPETTTLVPEQAPLVVPEQVAGQLPGAHLGAPIQPGVTGQAETDLSLDASGNPLPTENTSTPPGEVEELTRLAEVALTVSGGEDEDDGLTALSQRKIAFDQEVA